MPASNDVPWGVIESQMRQIGPETDIWTQGLWVLCHVLRLVAPGRMPEGGGTWLERGGLSSRLASAKYAAARGAGTRATWTASSVDAVSSPDRKGAARGLLRRN